MSLVWVDNAESVALQLVTNKLATTENLVLHLYKSNTTPAETDVVGTYTESTFAGYASATLTGANWTVSGTAPTQIAYAQQTFTRSSSGATENQYGYYVTRAVSADLMYAERFSDAPVPITNLNDAIKITPQITCD